jgi:phosphoserine phosphatase RsbU/P
MITENATVPDQSIEQLLYIKSQQMQSLLEVTRAINNNVHAPSLWQAYELILSQHLAPKRIALFFFDHTWHKIFDIHEEQGNISYLPDSVIDTNEPREVTPTEQAMLPGIRYIIPVFHKDQPLAFVLLGEIQAPSIAQVPDLLDFAQVITNIVVVAIENKRLFKKEIEKKEFDKELELASRVQGMLIPARLPKNTMYEFAGMYQPHRGIGGDYYDVIHVNRDEFYFCIADISGKGIAAALVMANLQAYLNSSLLLNETKEKFVTVLNQKVLSITNGDHFITLFIAKYNIRTRELTYLNAGHNPPVLIQNGDYKLLEKGCTVLGVFEEIPTIEFGTEKIAPDTTIVCYTDGITEMENEEGEEYGEDRLVSFVQSYHTLGPEVFNKKLFEDISKFKGNRLFNDDISVLTCKFM